MCSNQLRQMKWFAPLDNPQSRQKLRRHLLFWLVVYVALTIILCAPYVSYSFPLPHRFTATGAYPDYLSSLSSDLCVHRAVLGFPTGAEKAVQPVCTSLPDLHG